MYIINSDSSSIDKQQHENDYAEIQSMQFLIEN